MRRHGMTLAELVSIIAVLAVLVLLLLPYIGRSRPSALRASCANNLKQLGLAFEMYMNESKGEKFPSMKYAGGRDCNQLAVGEFFFQPDQLCPEYIIDPVVTICPASGLTLNEAYYCNGDGGAVCPCVLRGDSYFYMGYFISPEYYVKLGADPAAPDGKSLYQPFCDLLRALTERQRAATTVEQAFAAADVDILEMSAQPGTENRFFRLREGVERFFITDVMNPAAYSEVQSRAAVLWEVFDDKTKRFPHVPEGGNVLFTDGHVAFQLYNKSEHPYNPTWGHLIRTLR